MGAQPNTLAIDLAEFKLGWRILVLSVLGVATSVTAALLYGFGAMIVPLQEAMGWSRGAVQSAITFLFAGAIISTQIIGWLNMRFGIRAVTALSLASLVIGYLALTQVRGSIVWLYIGVALLPLIAPGTLAVTWTQIVNLWFDRNRGLALALILSGTGLAAAIMPALISMAVARWDWRAGFIILALPPLLLTLPLTLLWMREPTSEATATPEARRLKALALTGVSFRQGLRSRQFWTCNIALLFVVAGIVAMVTSTVPLLRDKGLSATQAGQIFGTFGLSLIVGRVLVGYLIDRVWAPAVATVALGLPAIGCLIFLVADAQVPMLIAATMLVGIGAGAEFDIAAFLIARYFGMRNYGRLFGFHIGLATAGSAVTPVLVGWSFETTGSYTVTLIACVVAFGAGSLALLTLGRYPQLE
ncbi:MAG: MFS transporter [Gammaproteobacteria bacterium]|nr:MFS transporter [Gammaproteobacteria bacterium]